LKNRGSANIEASNRQRHETVTKRTELRPDRTELRLGCSQNATRLCHSDVTVDDDLATVIEAWPKLPAALKSGILAMICGATK
jgi:hypothetical protein